MCVCVCVSVRRCVAHQQHSSFSFFPVHKRVLPMRKNEFFSARSMKYRPFPKREDSNCSSECRFNHEKRLICTTKRDLCISRKETHLYHEKRPIYISNRLKLVIGMDWEIRKPNSQNSGFFSNLLVDKTLSSTIRDNEDDALAIHLYHAKRPICITKRDPFISRKETHLYHGRTKS